MSIAPVKGGKRERTRAALVRATLELAEAKGFAAASLDEIAARAGMTKGAIYSNFSGRADLLLAAMSAKGFTLSGDRAAATSLKEELAATTKALVAMLRRARREAAFLAEFQLYALADPELRAGMAESYAESFAGTAAYLASLEGSGSAMPPKRLAVALQAISMGFLVQALVTPKAITDEVVEETMQALARGLVGPG
jgi:AcrR family transcriptional regulator